MSKCESFTDESLTVTANNDGSFTIDGTTASGTPIYSNAYTGERSITTADQLDNVKHLKNGTYQYVGDSSIVVQIIEYNDASDRDIRYNSSNDGTFTITGEKSYNYVRLYTNGTTYDNKTITFMICPSNIYNADPKLEPYAMTNAELTAAIRTIQAQLAE